MAWSQGISIAERLPFIVASLERVVRPPTDFLNTAGLAVPWAIWPIIGRCLRSARSLKSNSVSLASQIRALQLRLTVLPNEFCHHSANAQQLAR